MVLFCRLGTRRVRNDCCEERQVRKVRRTQPKTSTDQSEGKVLLIHPKHMEEVLFGGTQSQHSEGLNHPHRKEDGQSHDVQGHHLQSLKRPVGEGMVTHQHLPNCLGDADQSNGGDQQHAAE